MLDKSPMSYRWVILISTISLFISLLFYFTELFSFHTAKVVFCDVGQGDGVYIRTSSGTDVVIDAGRDNSMLACLGKYMPFFDKTIEYAFLSHPQVDHYGGFLGMLKNYRITNFYRSSGDNTAKSFTQLKQLLKTSKSNIHTIYAPTRLSLDYTSSLMFMWPVKEHTSSDLNDYSQIFILTLDNNRYLFTGDTSPSVLSMIEDIYPIAFFHITVLKVPHHGSKNGLTHDFLKLADPTLSVISVAAKNRYHHPSFEVLDFFKALGKPYITTAQHGDIVVTIDEEQHQQLVARGADGSVLKLLLPR